MKTDVYFFFFLKLGFRLADGLCADINECDIDVVNTNKDDYDDSYDDDADALVQKICGDFGECVNLLGKVR